MARMAVRNNKSNRLLRPRCIAGHRRQSSSATRTCSHLSDIAISACRSPRGVRSRNVIRPAIRIEASVPVLIYKGSSGKEFSVCAVEHVEHSIAVRLQKELAVLATPHSIDEHDVFGRIPVVAVVGRELVMPFPLAGIGIESDNGVCEEIVPITANRAVNLRSRISHRPIQSVESGLV